MEQQTEVKFVITAAQLQAVLDFIARLPYNQAQPYVDLLTKLPREAETTQG